MNNQTDQANPDDYNEEDISRQQRQIDVSKDFILSIVVPEQTNTYKPIAHKTLIDSTLEAIASCGFNVLREVYTYSKNGMRANGKYMLEFGDDPDMSIMIAWQNSYDKSLSVKFAIGTWVFVCTNGMVSGDMGAFRSKHVGDVQEITPAKLKEYICGAREVFYSMVESKEKMKEIEITPRERAELLGRLFIETEMITSTQLNIVKNEIQTPTYDYGAPDTIWELYNYVTFALKDANPRFWLQAQIDVHKFFINEFNIS